MHRQRQRHCQPFQQLLLVSTLLAAAVLLAFAPEVRAGCGGQGAAAPAGMLDSGILQPWEEQAVEGLASAALQSWEGEEEDGQAYTGLESWEEQDKVGQTYTGLESWEEQEEEGQASTGLLDPSSAQSWEELMLSWQGVLDGQAPAGSTDWAEGNLLEWQALAGPTAFGEEDLLEGQAPAGPTAFGGDDLLERQAPAGPTVSGEGNLLAAVHQSIRRLQQERSSGGGGLGGSLLQ